MQLLLQLRLCLLLQLQLPLARAQLGARVGHASLHHLQLLLQLLHLLLRSGRPERPVAASRRKPRCHLLTDGGLCLRCRRCCQLCCSASSLALRRDLPQAGL